MSDLRQHMLISDYDAKDASYYGYARADYVEALPTNRDAAVLELGCANGATGSLVLRAGKAGRYVGIELVPEAAAEARRALTEVHCGNVEQMTLPYGPGTFDALILSEVIEHLVDPWSVVHRLTSTLKSGAIVLASSPNISHWRNIVELLRGRFRYADEGMMDSTHLRWFTPESYRELFENAGVVVDRLTPVHCSHWWQRLAMRTPLAHTVYHRIDLRGHFDPDRCKA